MIFKNNFIKTIASCQKCSDNGTYTSDCITCDSSNCLSCTPVTTFLNSMSNPNVCVPCNLAIDNCI